MCQEFKLNYILDTKNVTLYICCVNDIVIIYDSKTDYGLDGLGSNPGGDEIFRLSRPALGPTQPPVKWVPVFPGGKVQLGHAADHSTPSSAAVMEE